MQAVCRFYKWTPDEYKRMTVEELDVFVDKANDEIKARERAANRRR